MASLSLEERIDQTCDRFEAAWMAGERPRIEDYIAEFSEAERPLLLDDLLKLEIELRAADSETWLLRCSTSGSRAIRKQFHVHQLFVHDQPGPNQLGSFQVHFLAQPR
jgi:hypothetical protein